MKLLSLEGLIFLSYFCSYRIEVIYTMLHNYGEFTIEDFFKEFNMRSEMLNRLDSKGLMTPKHFNDAYKNLQICLQQLNYFDVQAIPFFDERFPKALKDLSDCPPVIYVKGKLRSEVSMAAIVGTRKMSQFGARKTAFVTDLMNASNLGVVSGLAEGIDTVAHHQTLQNKHYTIAVLAQPLSKIFPQENYGLANDILKSGGALVSELPFGISRGKTDFVMRNRIQVALSKIVVPIELEPKSGTMWTVDYTKQLKRQLFVIVPSAQEESLAQYSGILHLINQQKQRPIPNVHIIQNSDQFKKKIGQFFTNEFFHNGQTELF
jgi:DNA protecting protein DprA